MNDCDKVSNRLPEKQRRHVELVCGVSKCMLTQILS